MWKLATTGAEMKKLKSYFEESFGIPIPEYMLPDIELVPLDNEDPDEAFLFGTPIALKKQYLIQGAIYDFIDNCPQGYFLIGFWGHGVNSYAFYYSRVDEWSRVLFRLPYGGIYMDNEENAGYIREFLANYFTFEQTLKNKYQHLIATESMGRSFYEVLSADNEIWNTEELFFRDPDFEERFFQSLKPKKSRI